MKRRHEAKLDSAEKAVRDIRRATRKQYSAEEKIRIVLEGLRGGHPREGLHHEARERDEDPLYQRGSEQRCRPDDWYQLVYLCRRRLI
jgi:hypothetical protein